MSDSNGVAALAATPTPVDISKLSSKERTELVIKEIRSIADGMENGTIKLITAGSNPRMEKRMRKGHRAPLMIPTGEWIITVIYKNIAAVTAATAAETATEEKQ